MRLLAIALLGEEAGNDCQARNENGAKLADEAPRPPAQRLRLGREPFMPLQPRESAVRRSRYSLGAGSS